MKKTLLSIIAGLMVAGTAFAVPDVGDRKALCEKYPDRYVWVEATEACIPLNPCESNDESIRNSYCSKFKLYNFGSNRDLVIGRYAEKVLGTKVSDIKEVSDCNFGVKTSDGGYLLIQCWRNFRNEGYFNANDYSYTPVASEVPDKYTVAFALADASQIYDRYYMGLGLNVFDDRMIEEQRYLNRDVDLGTCEDIADFASLLSGTLIKHSVMNNGGCEFKW